jgi:hypothetical protein
MCFQVVKSGKSVSCAMVGSFVCPFLQHQQTFLFLFENHHGCNLLPGASAGRSFPVPADA